MPTPVPLARFSGLYDRGESESVPLNYLRDSQNLAFIDAGFETRRGHTLLFPISSVLHFEEFEIQGQAARLLVLDSSGNLWDSLNPSSPILSIPGMTDFSMVSMFSRAYISPSNGITGLPGEKIYVYDGSGVARPAGGVVPSGALTVVTGSNSGDIEPGERVFAVSFVSHSGFVTRPGAFKTYSAPGGFTALVSDIPVGQPDTVTRRLLVTKPIIDFNGDFENQEYFFVPNGEIPNNLPGETKEVSFFDNDLQASSDYLFEQMETIPAGVFLSTYRGALVSGGEDANRDIVRISKFGEPESFDEVEGYMEINPGDAKFGVRNAVELRDNLVIFKNNSVYSTQDNGDNPAFWNYIEVDGSNGTECHGIAQVINKESSLIEGLVICARPGVYFFNGAFPQIPLTHNIEEIWKKVNKAVFHKIEAAIDTHKKLIYIAVPLNDEDVPCHVLVCDYSKGMSPDLVCWDIWKFPETPDSISVTYDPVTRIPRFLYGSSAGNVYYQSEARDDHGVAIDSFALTAYVGMTDEQYVNQYSEMRFRVLGFGTLSLRCQGFEDINTLDLLPFLLTPNARFPLMRTMNFVDMGCSIRFGVNAFGHYFRVRRITVQVSVEAYERPNLDVATVTPNV